MKSPSAHRLALASIAWLVATALPLRGAAEESGHKLFAFARAVYRETSDETFRKWLREKVHQDDDDRRYGIHFDDDWQHVAAKSPELPLVVLIHGFNSTAAHNAAVMAPIHDAGFPSASFSYPNDSSPAESALLLSRQLKTFAKDHPKTKVALLTHSMGGLVARACIEDPALDPGNVSRLVMVAPPSQGTLVARTAIGADLWEHWFARRDGAGWTRWRDSVVDGLGEAADDLLPGSPFLTKLNARPRNARVRYAIFLGTHSPLSERDLEYLRWTLRTAGSHIERVQDYTDSIDKLVADMDEVVDGRGDGAVAIKRGRLDGVADVVLLPFDHLSCTGEPDSDAVRRLQKEVLARLR